MVKGNANWRYVENSISKRMVNNSVIHFFDKTQKTTSEKTQFINEQLKKVHISSYAKYVRVKSASLKRFKTSNLNVFDFDDVASKNVKNNNSNISNVRNFKKDEEKCMSESEYIEGNNNIQEFDNNDVDDITLYNENDSNLLLVNNTTIPNVRNNKKDNENENHHHQGSSDNIKTREKIEENDDNNSINNDKSNDAKTNKQYNSNSVCTDNLTVQYNDNDVLGKAYNEAQSIIYGELSNNFIVSDTSDKSINISRANIPQTQNDNKTVTLQKGKPVLKITSTEVVKPKYTIVRDPQRIINRSKNVLRKQIDEDKMNNYVSIKKIICQDNDSVEENFIASSQYMAIGMTTKIAEKKQINDEIKNNINWNSLYKKKMSKYCLKKNFNDNTYENLLNKQCINTADGRRIRDIDNQQLKRIYSGKQAVLPTSVANKIKLCQNHKNRKKYNNDPSDLLHSNYINISRESSDNTLSRSETNSVSQQSYSCRRRPTTLHEFVKMTNLKPLTDTRASFTLEDLSENEEIFIMEIPKSIIDSQQLIGQSMQIKKRFMTIGDTKYRLQHKKNNILTWIMKEDNEDMSFKAVNIQPKASFVIEQQIPLSKVQRVLPHTLLNDTNNPVSFPKKLKIRNPLANNNQKLKTQKFCDNNVNYTLNYSMKNIYKRKKLKLK